MEVHRGRHAIARPDHRVRYECGTTQDVLYVRLAPGRHDRSVPMLSMDARPLYLRLLGGTMGVLTRGWYTYHLGDVFFIFPRGRADALHTVAKCCPRMDKTY